MSKEEFSLPLKGVASSMTIKSARIASATESQLHSSSTSNLLSTRGTVRANPVNIEFDKLDLEAVLEGGGRVTIPRGKYERLVQAISQLQQQVHDLEMENRRLRVHSKHTSRRHSPNPVHGRSYPPAKGSKHNQHQHVPKSTRTPNRPNTREKYRDSRGDSLSDSKRVSVADGESKSPDEGLGQTGIHGSDSDVWEESTSEEVVETITRSTFKLDLSKVNLRGAKALADLSGSSKDISSFEITESGTYRQGAFALNKDGIRVQLESNTKEGNSRPKRTGISSKDLVLLRILGRGSSAVVYKCYRTSQRKFVALKVINIFEQEKRRQLAKELNTYTSTITNPFLINFYGAYFEEGSISLALEYMDNGSLQDLIERTGRGLPEHLNANISRQVLEGLKFLHDNHKIHRDLKPANILLDKRGQCKITDFGILANVNDTKDPHDLSECKTFVGTLYYMSPERLEGKPYSYGSDIWAFGLTILACAIGKHPITSKDHLDLMSKFKTLPKLISSEVNMTNITLKFADFLTPCIDMAPSRRPSCTRLLRHPFVGGSISLSGAAETLARSPHWVSDDKNEGKSLDEDLFRICDEYAKKTQALQSAELCSLSGLFRVNEKRIQTQFQKLRARHMLS
ncbi:hypothetical protein AAMO2058_000733100 [Amorphochlora amoebiformis]